MEKRLVVREELRIRKGHKREPIEEAVRVRRMHAEVERVPSASRGRAARIRRATPPRATPPKGAKN